MQELKIGNRLRKLRKDRGISIADLSEKSGVSTGLISQIERDLVVPSVVSLYRIAQALNTNINYFFETSQSNDFGLIRKGDHKILTTGGGSTSYMLLSPNRGEHVMDMAVVTLKAGQTYEKQDVVSHEGEECGYVLSGVLTVLLDGQEYTLQAGDSIYFYSSLPHKYVNRGDVDCISVWSMTPKFF